MGKGRKRISLFTQGHISFPDQEKDRKSPQTFFPFVRKEDMSGPVPLVDDVI